MNKLFDPLNERKNYFEIWRLLEELEPGKRRLFLLRVVEASTQSFYPHQAARKKVGIFFFGVWFSAVNNQHNPSLIAELFDVSLTEYQVAIEFGKNEAKTNATVFENAYENFSKIFQQYLIYYFFHSEDGGDFDKIKDDLLKAMPKKELPVFIFACAQKAYANHYEDKEKAEMLALYRAGLWYTLITGLKQTLSIAVAFDVLETTYQIAKMKSEIELLDGNHLVLKRAYDDFLTQVKQIL
jgi:hypothetical protein